MDTLADTLWQEFAVETEEHLQTVEPILSHGEPERIGAPDIAQLFRSFHSVKGLARALDVLGMEGVAHHAENLLGLVRDGRAALTPDIADLLLQSVDALKAAAQPRGQRTRRCRRRPGAAGAARRGLRTGRRRGDGRGCAATARSRRGRRRGAA